MAGWVERERGGFGAGAMSSVTKKSALKSSTKGQTSNLSSSSNMKGKSGAGKVLHKSSASGVQGSRKSGMSASQVGDNKSQEERGENAMGNGPVGSVSHTQGADNSRRVAIACMAVCVAFWFVLFQGTALQFSTLSIRARTRAAAPAAASTSIPQQIARAGLPGPIPKPILKLESGWRSAVYPLYAPLVGGKTNYYTMVAGVEWQTKLKMLTWNNSMLIRRFEQTGSFLSEATRTPDVQPLDAQTLFQEHERRDHDLWDKSMGDLLYSHRRWAGVDLSIRRFIWFLSDVLAKYKPEWIALEKKGTLPPLLPPFRLPSEPGAVLSTKRS